MMKVVQFVRNNSFAIVTNTLLILFAVVLFVNTKRIYDDNKNPPELKEFRGGIQNHLVWSVRGECYFVRPHNDYTVYLIRSEDCDKK